MRQSLTSVDRNALPVDLRLVFDTSGSISETDLDEYLKAMREVASALRAEVDVHMDRWNEIGRELASRFLAVAERSERLSVV